MDSAKDFILKLNVNESAKKLIEIIENLYKN